MPCRVGITTDPERRRHEWQERFPALHHWQILACGLTKHDAQIRQTLEAIRHGCAHAPIGSEVENTSWSVYYFEYNQT